MHHFRILLLSVFTLLLLCRPGQAQEVPLNRVDPNTFTFSTRNVTPIRNFELTGPSYHITDDPYRFELRALTPEGSLDSAVTGNYSFVINDRAFELAFNRGIAAMELALGEADYVKVQLAHTDLVQTQEIMRFRSWPKMAGILLFLLLTFLFRHQLAALYRVVFSSKR